jgi:DNA-binding NarL/FixJ family response regulator
MSDAVSTNIKDFNICQYKINNNYIYSLIFSELNDSEVRVIPFLLLNATNKDISTELDIRADTISKRITDMKEKFGVKTRIGLRSVINERILSFNAVNMMLIVEKLNIEADINDVKCK